MLCDWQIQTTEDLNYSVAEAWNVSRYTKYRSVQTLNVDSVTIKANDKYFGTTMSDVSVQHINISSSIFINIYIYIHTQFNAAYDITSSFFQELFKIQLPDFPSRPMGCVLCTFSLSTLHGQPFPTPRMSTLAIRSTCPDILHKIITMDRPYT